MTDHPHRPPLPGNQPVSKVPSPYSVPTLHPAHDAALSKRGSPEAVELAELKHHAISKGCAIASVSTTMLVASFALMVAGIVKWISEGASAAWNDMVQFFGGQPAITSAVGMGSNGIFYAMFGVLLFGSFLVTRIALAGRKKKKTLVVLPKQKALPAHVLTAMEKQEKLFRTLTADNQKRHAALVEKAGKLRKLAESIDDPETKAGLMPGLEKLQWLHMKSLLGKEQLADHTNEELRPELETKVQSLRDSLAQENLTGSAKESLRATLEMTEERLRHVMERKGRMSEINADIDRIEAQLDLSLERAALLSSGHRGSFQVDLATRMVERSDLFGSSMPLVSELDSHFQHQKELE